MPRTPVDVRLTNSRTSSTAKRIALRFLVTSSTSSAASHSATPISRSSSPSSKRMASLPAALMLVKASMLLRRTEPCAVANMTWSLAQLSSSSGSGRTVVIVSSSASGSSCFMKRPFDCGEPAGSFHTLRR